MNCRKACKNFPTCRFSEEGSKKEHCNFYIEIEAPETPRPIGSDRTAGSATGGIDRGMWVQDYNSGLWYECGESLAVGEVAQIRVNGRPFVPLTSLRDK